jgi:hypothetical protein
MIRNLLRAADFVPLFYAAGFLTAMGNPRLQRIGDLVAGTMVVREEADPGGARRPLGLPAGSARGLSPSLPALRENARAHRESLPPEVRPPGEARRDRLHPRRAPGKAPGFVHRSQVRPRPAGGVSLSACSPPIVRDRECVRGRACRAGRPKESFAGGLVLMNKQAFSRSAVRPGSVRVPPRPRRGAREPRLASEEVSEFSSSSARSATTSPRCGPAIGARRSSDT